MQQAFQVAATPIYQGEKPVRNPQYARFVKRFPCIACGGSRCVDPAHTGIHALGQKSSDMRVLPLCRQCHDEFDANPRDFAVVHDLDITALIAFFNHLWELKQRKIA